MRTHYIGHDDAYRRRKAAGAAGWDEPEVSAAVLHQFERLLSHASVLPASRLIEFGCGAGNLSVGFARLDFQVTGIDISPTAIEWARERAADQGLPIAFRVGDVVSLSDSDSSYEVAVDSHCLHCLIGQDRLAFLLNARRLLVNDGALVVNTMCQNPNTHRLDGFDASTGVIQHSGIATRFIGTRDLLESEIWRAGFEIVESHIESHEEQMDDLLIVALPIREA